MTKGDLEKMLSTFTKDDDIEIMVKMPDWYPYKYEDILKIQELYMCDEREEDGSIYEADLEDGGKRTIILYPHEAE